jgi:ABC-type Fe3+/spermidine/putrescine transport system ATPase subunit
MLGGKDITHTPPNSRKFGLVPQDLVLFPHLDVRGNVAYGLRARKTPQSMISTRVDDLLNKMGLEGKGSRGVDTLSGGERQRVALARALAIEPPFLLLDEPFSALDSPLRMEMRTELLSIKDRFGVSVIFVTHNQDEALSISDRIVLMHGGRVIQEGTPEEVFRRPVDSFAAEFIGAANLLHVRVTNGDSGAVSMAGLEFRLPVPMRVSAGAEGRLLLRPHHVKIGSNGQAPALPGRITGRRFYGNRYEYRCETKAGEITVTSGDKREAGEEVMLSFNPEDAFLLPEG